MTTAGGFGGCWSFDPVGIRSGVSVPADFGSVADGTCWEGLEGGESGRGWSGTFASICGVDGTEVRRGISLDGVAAADGAVDSVARRRTRTDTSPGVSIEASREAPSSLPKLAAGPSSGELLALGRFRSP